MSNKSMQTTKQASPTRTIEGITFAVDGDEPKARDLDIAAKLGLDRPRDIRKLVTRWAHELGPVEQRATEARYEIRPGVWHSQPATESWLTEEQALFIVAKSDTETATAVLKEIIRVFVLARKGLLPAVPALDTATLVAALDRVLTPIMAAVAAQNDRLAALEERVRDGSILAPEKVNAIKARVSSCASDLAKVGLEKRRAASLRIHKRLKMRVGWFGDHCRLDNMPARHEPEVLRELEIVEHETRGKVESARQLKIPHLSLVPTNANGRKSG